MVRPSKITLGMTLSFLWAAVLLMAPEVKANQVSMQLIGVPSGAPTMVVSDPSAGYTNANAVIDPYIAKVGGVTTLIWCVDPDHTVNIGDTWTANVSTLGGSLANTLLDNGQLYGELAWLVTQLASATNTTTKLEIQAAIWSLADPGDFSYALSSNAGFANAVSGFEASAVTGALTSGFEILTDASTTNPKQEFIVLTPEPGTLLLLGIGLLALAFTGRRKLIEA